MTRTEADSRVSAVTVYQGRALITREAKFTLKPGEHSLVFPELPANLDRDSLQVKGMGEAVLGGCVFETQHFKEDVSQHASTLLKRQQELMDEAAALELKLNRIQGEKAFIEKIAACVTTPQQIENSTGPKTKISPECLNVATWKDLTGFYRERHKAADSEKLEIDKRNRDLKKEMKMISTELQDLGHREIRSRDIVRVNVTKMTRGELTLHLSYTVPGPSWKPVYNLRATSNSNKLLLEYDAMVTQATGEDWEDTELKLSTARISVSGTIPTLDPWRINFYHPPVPLPVRSNERKKRSARPEDEMPEMAAAPQAEQLLELSSVTVKEASVEQAGAGVLFKVAGTAGITGDNRETRVAVSRIELPAEYLYRSVPKLTEFAYRIAKFSNTSPFPILPGGVNIFHDGSLISSSVFKLIMPGQESDSSMGVHEGIKVEYRFIKKFRKNEGLLNKRTSMQFEYCIKLENNTDQEIELEIFDQFPMSQDKDIEVKPILPEIDKKQQDITVDEESKITWQLKLDPAEKTELPVAYLVEYPVDRIVSGL